MISFQNRSRNGKLFVNGIAATNSQMLDVEWKRLESVVSLCVTLLAYSARIDKDEVKSETNIQLCVVRTARREVRIIADEERERENGRVEVKRMKKEQFDKTQQK